MGKNPTCMISQKWVWEHGSAWTRFWGGACGARRMIGNCQINSLPPPTQDLTLSELTACWDGTHEGGDSPHPFECCLHWLLAQWVEHQQWRWYSWGWEVAPTFVSATPTGPLLSEPRTTGSSTCGSGEGGLLSWDVAVPAPPRPRDPILDWFIMELGPSGLGRGDGKQNQSSFFGQFLDLHASLELKNWAIRQGRAGPGFLFDCCK